MNWISTKDQLPAERKYVLARHNRGTWVDNDDQENVNCVVVKLVKGISLDERRKMEKGEIPQTFEEGWSASTGWTKTERSSIYKACDEQGNNLVPYNWEAFGPDSFFGQTITHWMPIESF